MAIFSPLTGSKTAIWLCNSLSTALFSSKATLFKCVKEMGENAIALFAAAQWVVLVQCSAMSS